MKEVKHKSTVIDIDDSLIVSHGDDNLIGFTGGDSLIGSTGGEENIFMKYSEMLAPTWSL